jgi:hypothetical protein
MYRVTVGGATKQYEALTSSHDRTPEFITLTGVGKHTTYRRRSVGRVSQLYRQATEAGSRWAHDALRMALDYAQRSAVTGAELSHVAIIRDTVVQRREAEQLHESLHAYRQQRFHQFARPNALPRVLALVEIEQKIMSIEHLMALVTLLVKRQEASVVRLEEGTLHMEDEIERADRALRRTRLTGHASTLCWRLALVGAVAGAVALLLL